MCTTANKQKKYATLEQLKFEKQQMKYELMNRINYMEQKYLAFKGYASKREEILRKLAPLYAHLMDIWRRENER